MRLFTNSIVLCTLVPAQHVDAQSFARQQPIAAEYAAAAKVHGYILLIRVNTAHAEDPVLFNGLRCDSLKSLGPIA